MFGEKRFDQSPKLVGHQQLAHGVLHDDDATQFGRNSLP
jgi:hypothetical protein